jgi:hypothetical protein
VSGRSSSDFPNDNISTREVAAATTSYRKYAWNENVHAVVSSLPACSDLHITFRCPVLSLVL